MLLALGWAGLILQFFKESVQLWNQQRVRPSMGVQIQRHLTHLKSKQVPVTSAQEGHWVILVDPASGSG